MRLALLAADALPNHTVAQTYFGQKRQFCAAGIKATGTLRLSYANFPVHLSFFLKKHLLGIFRKFIHKILKLMFYSRLNKNPLA